MISQVKFLTTSVGMGTYSPPALKVAPHRPFRDTHACISLRACVRACTWAYHRWGGQALLPEDPPEARSREELQAKSLAAACSAF